MVDDISKSMAEQERENHQFIIDQLRQDKIIYAVEACVTNLICLFGFFFSNQYFHGVLKDSMNIPIWWYRLSRQFLGKNKTKLNRSRNSQLSFQIHLCWCLIVKRLMQALMIVKREVFT